MKLTKKAFEAWLKEKPSSGSVGFTCAADQCPLAHFTGKKADYGLIGNQPMPKWAKNFVDTVDELAPDRTIQQLVTAQQALEILRGIK